MRLVIGTALVVACVTPAAAEQTPSPDGTLPLLEAVRTALSHHPTLQIQERVVAIQGAVATQAAAPFNQVFEAGLDRARVYSPAPLPGVPGLQLSPTGGAQVGASFAQMLRNGMRLGGTLDVDRAITGALSGLTTSRAAVQADLPLMRGRGRDVTTADERAAALGRDSAVLDLRHAAAVVITSVVTSYWNLAAAQQSLAVATASTERETLLLDNLRALIAADQLPRSDAVPATASLADREATRVSATQLYIEARQQLIVDMGQRLDELPPTPRLDDFPDADRLPAPDLPGDPQAFIAAALRQRADYAAAETRVQAARVRRDAARNGLLPAVNFQLELGYTGFAQGGAFSNYFAGLASHVRGPNVTGRVTYQFPSQNSLAIGRLEQTEAELQRAQLELADLARLIHSSVITTFNAVRNARLRLDLARQSVAAFKTALEGERDKLTLGSSSIVELLTIEDRLTSAADREVAARQAYAAALVEFRFATGTLVPARGPMPALDAEVFTTVPSVPLMSGR